MSMWQFNATVEGYLDAHVPEQGMSGAEQDDIWAWMMAKEGRPN